VVARVHLRGAGPRKLTTIGETTIQIAISQAALDAIVATMMLGSVGYEAERTEKGEVHIWLEERWVRELSAR
jgi:hypothetical protein